MELNKSNIAAALGISEQTLDQLTATIDLRRTEAQLLEYHTAQRATEDAAIQAVTAPIEVRRTQRESILQQVRDLIADAEQGKTVTLPDGATLLAQMKG
jgi:hypothetical protein